MGMRMKSIIQREKEKCFLCGGNGHIEPLDEHHIFFGPYRGKSEKYGLKVYLHHSSCHIFGEKSVHKNAKINNRLQRYAQTVAMKHYGWTKEKFITIFGRNYL